MDRFRIERDSLGEMKVPAGALWGAQTQRAVENFPVSGQRMPRPFIGALGLIKASAARVNAALGLIDRRVADAIEKAAMQVARGAHDAEFPVDVFQTGSGTSSNMNANEVIAALAARALRRRVHANDHVNFGQSSNDVIPTAIHVAAVLSARETLLPALTHLERVLARRARALQRVIKTGRTHLMDAMPLSLGQELSGWRQQVVNGRERVESALTRLRRLPQGGTAVGTGINADPRFAVRFVRDLTRRTGCRFEVSPNYFEALSAQDAAAELSAQLKVIACSLMKIGNDLRLMNSGPLAGLGEIELPTLQPGSSIMPGKVNPVIPEAVCMVAAQVIGNDTAITVAAQSGSFQLNVMLPVVARNLLESVGLLAAASRLLADRAVAGFAVRHARIAQALERNPILVTALNSRIGYEQGAAIAKQAYAEGRPVIEVAHEVTGLPVRELRRLLDPVRLIHNH
jgi:fumarate hydratase, class II